MIIPIPKGLFQALSKVASKDLKRPSINCIHFSKLAGISEIKAQATNAIVAAVVKWSPSSIMKEASLSPIFGEEFDFCVPVGVPDSRLLFDDQGQQTTVKVSDVDYQNIVFDGSKITVSAGAFGCTSSFNVWRNSYPDVEKVISGEVAAGNFTLRTDVVETIASFMRCFARHEKQKIGATAIYHGKNHPVEFVVNSESGNKSIRIVATQFKA